MLGETRRSFFNRATVILLSTSLAGFGASLVGFLWKGASGGFGSKINAGKIDDVIQSIRSNKGFLYLSEARAWVTEYPKDLFTATKLLFMQAWKLALWRCTKSVRTLVVEFQNARARNGSSALAMVRSTTVLVRKKADQLHVAWTILVWR